MLIKREVPLNEFSVTKYQIQEEVEQELYEEGATKVKIGWHKQTELVDGHKVSLMICTGVGLDFKSV